MVRPFLALFLLSAPASGGVITPWAGDLARPRVGMHASLKPDGPWLPAALSGFTILEVHDTTAKQPRFIVRLDGATVLLYAEAEKLETVAVQDTSLVPSADQLAVPFTAKTPGILLRSGTRLDARADIDGHSSVRWSTTAGGESFEVRGVVATANVGTVYRAGVRPSVAPRFEPTLTLPGEYQLLDKPKGTAFVFHQSPDRVQAVKLAVQRGFSLVRVIEGATGWIATAQTRALKRRSGDDELTFSRDDLGMLLGRDPNAAGPTTTLPVGTPLFDAIDGTPIGEVETGFHESPHATNAKWARYRLTSDYGPIEVWAKNP